MTRMDKLTLIKLAIHLKVVGVNAIDVLNERLLEKRQELLLWEQYEKEILAVEYQIKVC